MQQRSRWIGLVACAALVLAALNRTDSLASFVDARGLGLTLGLTLCGLWASFGHRRVLAAFAAALRAGAGDGEGAARAVLARGHVLAWSSGGLACLIGVMVELTALASPAEFTSGVARAALSLLYGALLAEIGFANLKHWLTDEARDSARRLA